MLKTRCYSLDSFYLPALFLFQGHVAAIRRGFTSTSRTCNLLSEAAFNYMPSYDSFHLAKLSPFSRLNQPSIRSRSPG
jgi:hypothetical protein